MNFQTPAFLWLIALLLPLAGIWAWMRGRADRRTEAFVARETWDVLNRSVSKPSRRWRAALLVAALAFATIAAARPLWGTRERISKASGIDIVLAVDVSRSMLARDMNGKSRLEAAKVELQQVLDFFPGQRVAIVPFAGDAFLQCPLTTDYGIARTILRDIGPQSVAMQGTNLARAIDVARGAYSNAAVGSRALVLVTDGENHEARLDETVKAAAAEGMRIYCLGIGSEDGTLIQLDGKTTLKDAEGKAVLSRLDASTLAKIADETGGVAWIAKPGERLDVRPLIDELGKLERGEFGDERARVLREERFQIPLAIALALFLAEGMIGERRRAPRATAGGAAA